MDVELAVDYVSMAARGDYDTAVLFSTDSDLRPALEASRGALLCSPRGWAGVFCSFMDTSVAGRQSAVSGDDAAGALTLSGLVVDVRAGLPQPAIDKLPEASAGLVEGFDPLRIVLFGSQARGEALPDSDLDLLVVVRRLGDKRV